MEDFGYALCLVNFQQLLSVGRGMIAPEEIEIAFKRVFMEAFGPVFLLINDSRRVRDLPHFDIADICVLAPTRRLHQVLNKVVFVRLD